MGTFMEKQIATSNYNEAAASISTTSWKNLHRQVSVMNLTKHFVSVFFPFQRFNRWKRNPKIPATWYFSRIVTSTASNPNSKVPSQFWYHNMVQNVHVGSDLSQVKYLRPCVTLVVINDFFLFYRNMDPPIWYDTDVKLFEIQRV